MRKTKFFKPFLEDKKRAHKVGKKTMHYATARLKKSGPGVYEIKENGKLVYVGFASKDVKKTLYRHFQKWVDKRNPNTKAQTTIERVSYFMPGESLAAFTCRVTFCNTATQAAILEQVLIQKQHPRDNKLKIEVIARAQYERILEIYTKAPEPAPNDLFND